MITWKQIDPKYAKDGYTESAFAIAFREGAPEIAKLLSDERGYYVDKKEAEVNGWKYRVKMVKSQKGDFTFIERGQTLGDERPEVTAHRAVQNGDYEKRQQDIQKAHLENIEASKALTAAINLLSGTLADYLKSRGTKDDKIVELLDAALKSLPMWNSADKLPPSGGRTA